MGRWDSRALYIGPSRPLSRRFVASDLSTNDELVLYTDNLGSSPLEYVSAILVSPYAYLVRT